MYRLLGHSVLIYLTNKLYGWVLVIKRQLLTIPIKGNKSRVWEQFFFDLKILYLYDN